MNATDMYWVDDRLERDDMHEVDGPSWFGQSSQPATIEKYGLTLDEYYAMKAEQDGKCVICEREETVVGKLLIEHDHSTGKVRGLACRRCNFALGLFDDNPEWLEAAAAYLRSRGCWLNRPLTDDEIASFAELEAIGAIDSTWRAQEGLTGRRALPPRADSK